MDSANLELDLGFIQILEFTSISVFLYLYQIEIYFHILMFQHLSRSDETFKTDFIMIKSVWFSAVRMF